LLFPTDKQTERAQPASVVGDCYSMQCFEVDSVECWPIRTFDYYGGRHFSAVW